MTQPRVLELLRFKASADNKNRAQKALLQLQREPAAMRLEKRNEVDLSRQFLLQAQLRAAMCGESVPACIRRVRSIWERRAAAKLRFGNGCDGI